MDTKTLKVLYQESFSSKGYQERYYNSGVSEWQEFFMKNMFEVFSKGLVSGERVVEVGAGPTIHLSALASKFCEMILTCDFTAVNRENLKMWLKNNPKALDWTAHLRLCAQIEGFSNVDDGSHEIAERLRNKVKDVLFCDVTQPYPLEKATEPFDVLITSLCCESAAINPDDYTVIIKNVASLVKSQGMIVILGILNCNWYYVGDTLFPCFPLQESLIMNAFALAGFTVRLYKEMKLGKIPDGTDTDEFFFAVFQKN